MSGVISLLVGLSGVGVGALLARRNARHDHGDKLLAEALNDLVSAIADVASGDSAAQRRYASATSRIALHGSPELVAALGDFQRDPTTETSDGRRRLAAAVRVARAEFGRSAVDAEAAYVLLFGKLA